MLGLDGPWCYRHLCLRVAQPIFTAPSVLGRDSSPSARSLLTSLTYSPRKDQRITQLQCLLQISLPTFENAVCAKFRGASAPACVAQTEHILPMVSSIIRISAIPGASFARSAEVRAVPRYLPPPGRHPLDGPEARRGDGRRGGPRLRHELAQRAHREPGLREDAGDRQGQTATPLTDGRRLKAWTWRVGRRKRGRSSGTWTGRESRPPNAGPRTGFLLPTARGSCLLLAQSLVEKERGPDARLVEGSVCPEGDVIVVGALEDGGPAVLPTEVDQLARVAS